MPAEKSNFTATEIKAGLMVLASVVVLVVFVGAIRGCDTGRVETNVFTAGFTSISGLDLGADVRFGGVKVGKVTDIGADPDHRSKITVVFEVPEDVPVNYGSVATVSQVSLTTGKHLEITTGNETEPLHVSGDRIASVDADDSVFGIPDLRGVVQRLENVLDGLVTLLGVERAELAAEANGDAMVDLAAVTASLGDVLDAGASTLNNIDGAITENRDEVQHIIEHLASIESAAADLVTNLNTVVEENRAPLNASLVNVENLSEEASARLTELTASLAVTLKYLEGVGGNAGHLAEEHGPTLEQILLNLEATTRNLKQFSETLAEQPGALVRGTKPHGRPDGGK
jgi:phospholipid/cholesterol/gamma-HCH transport system substrate-binding protein